MFLATKAAIVKHLYFGAVDAIRHVMGTGSYLLISYEIDRSCALLFIVFHVFFNLAVTLQLFARLSVQSTFSFILLIVY